MKKLAFLVIILATITMFYRDSYFTLRLMSMIFGILSVWMIYLPPVTMTLPAVLRLLSSEAAAVCGRLRNSADFISGRTMIGPSPAMEVDTESGKWVFFVPVMVCGPAGI